MESIRASRLGEGLVHCNQLEGDSQLVCALSRQHIKDIAVLVEGVSRRELWAMGFGLSKSTVKILKEFLKLATYGFFKINGAIIAPEATFIRNAIFVESLMATAEYIADILAASDRQKEAEEKTKLLKSLAKVNLDDSEIQEHCRTLDKYKIKQKDKKVIALMLLGVVGLKAVQLLMASGIDIPPKDMPFTEFAKQLNQLISDYNITVSLSLQIPISLIPAVISSYTLYKFLYESKGGAQSEQSDRQPNNTTAKDKAAKIVKLTQKSLGLTQHSLRAAAAVFLLAAGSKNLAVRLVGLDSGDIGYEDMAQNLIIVAICCSAGYALIDVVSLFYFLVSYHINKIKKGTEKDKQRDVLEDSQVNETDESDLDAEDEQKPVEGMGLLVITSEVDSDKKQNLECNRGSVVFNEITDVDQNDRNLNMSNKQIYISNVESYHMVSSV